MIISKLRVKCVKRNKAALKLSDTSQLNCKTVIKLHIPKHFFRCNKWQKQNCEKQLSFSNNQSILQ